MFIFKIGYNQYYMPFVFSSFMYHLLGFMSLAFSVANGVGHMGVPVSLILTWVRWFFWYIVEFLGQKGQVAYAEAGTQGLVTKVASWDVSYVVTEGCEAGSGLCICICLRPHPGPCTF